MRSAWFTRRLDVDTASHPDALNVALTARTMTLMFLAAAGCCTLAVLAPDLIHVREDGAIPVGIASLLAAVFWAVVFDRARRWMFHVALVYAIALITILVANVDNAALGMSFYIWAVICAFVFFPWREALWFLLPIGAGYALAIVMVGGESADPTTWVLSMITLTTVGLVIGETRTRLHDALRHAHRHALTDPLTGLRNRRALMEDLPAAVASGAPHRLALCDLNGFKAYNDTKGHQAGDRLLERLATRMERLVDDRGRVYRLGGDEFCVLWAMDAGIDAREIRHALSDISGDLLVSAAYGDVELPLEAADADAAMRLADERMYADKAVAHARAA